MMAVQVHENFKNYEPPFNVSATVERLLSSVKAPYLTGLGAVVLTNAAAQSSDRTWRRGGRKWQAEESYGVYHRETQNQPPWIEVLIDNLLAEWPPVLLRLSVCQDLVIGTTLYHEIGHHIAAPIGGTRDRETAAEAWSRKLSRSHFRREYWYLAPAIMPARLTVRTLIRLRNTIRKMRSPKS